MLVAAGTYGTSLIQVHGGPRAYTLASARDWLTAVTRAPDFLPLFFCLISCPLPRPYLLVLAPLCIAAAYHVGGYAARTMAGHALWKRFVASWWALMQARQGDAQTLVRQLQHCSGGARRAYGVEVPPRALHRPPLTTLRSLRPPPQIATCEIGFAISLVVTLISPQRSILTVIVMVNYLKLRYHSPSSSAAHRRAWQSIATRVDPYIDKVPAARRAVAYAQNWFTTPAQA